MHVFMITVWRFSQIWKMGAVSDRHTQLKIILSLSSVAGSNRTTLSYFEQQCCCPQLWLCEQFEASMLCIIHVFILQVSNSKYLYGSVSGDWVGAWRHTSPGRRCSVSVAALVLRALSARPSSWTVAAGAGSCRCRTCCSCLDRASSSCPCRASCRRVAPWRSTRSATDCVGSSSANLVCSRDSTEICRIKIDKLLDGAACCKRRRHLIL